MAAQLFERPIGERYEARRLLGEGGMAEVYEAHDPRLNRVVAIKLMHRHLSNDEQFKARFEREAQAIAQLKHPHIIQVYDFDHDKQLDQFFMVIEYVDGPTISAAVKQQGGLQSPQVIRIVDDLAEALGYAHAARMQHRDIKPSNIMLDKGKRTVLTDFGIAKLLYEGGEQLTASGALVGTPAYMSPEQASGVPGDHRSDIYSLGIVFYELATGRLPYKGDTPIATILKHIKEPPAPPTSINPSLPVGAEAVILRCIAKAPEDRYQSAGELLEHLRNLDLAAAHVGQHRTLAGKILSDDIFSMPTPTPSPMPALVTPTGEQLTATIATAPGRTSLFIGAGAVAIILLLAVGAFFFSTAGTEEDRPDPTRNACILTLDETIFARTDPVEDATASIEFVVDTQIEILRESGGFWLIRGDGREGWVSRQAIEVPAACAPA